MTGRRLLVLSVACAAGGFALTLAALAALVAINDALREYQK